MPLSKEKYRKLRKRVLGEIESQKKEHGYVVICPAFLSFTDIRAQEVEAAWPSVAKDLGLKPSSLDSKAWTIEGQEVTVDKLFPRK
jgi:hypothetical protein